MNSKFISRLRDIRKNKISKFRCNAGREGRGGMRSHKGVYGPGSRSIVLCVIHKRAWYKSTYTILPQLKIDVFIVSTRNYSPSWRTIE